MLFCSSAVAWAKARRARSAAFGISGVRSSERKCSSDACCCSEDDATLTLWGGMVEGLGTFWEVVLDTLLPPEVGGTVGATHSPPSDAEHRVGGLSCSDTPDALTAVATATAAPARGERRGLLIADAVLDSSGGGGRDDEPSLFAGCTSGESSSEDG